MWHLSIRFASCGEHGHDQGYLEEGGKENIISTHS